MDTTDISVVIPTWNRSELVGRAVKSVLRQVPAPKEVIVVDDGSTDQTQATLRAFADITVVHQSNAGVSAARNTGVEHASGAWIAFLDSDDYWHQGHLDAVQRAVVTTSGEADLYFCNAEREHEGEVVEHWELANFSPTSSIALVADASEWFLADRQPAMLQASVFSRSRYREVGGCWPLLRTREDTHLFLLTALGRPACAVDNVGARLTADADGGRLTTDYDHRTSEYLAATVSMYDDILNRRPDLPRDASNELRSRSATASLALAKAAVAERDPLGVLHLARALRQSPQAVGRRFASLLPRH